MSLVSLEYEILCLTSQEKVTAPVQWETIMGDLVAKGFDAAYELGPGKVRCLHLFAGPYCVIVKLFPWIGPDSLGYPRHLCGYVCLRCTFVSMIDTRLFCIVAKKTDSRARDACDADFHIGVSAGALRNHEAGR